MRVLSLFGGMECGRIALDRLTIPVDIYFSSEIDKHAIKVVQANYPDVIQLGDVIELATAISVFPDALGKIDLLIGGSPCQGFSFAGKQLNFDDTRSKLFFEFVKIKNILKPKYFLLENVKMKKESQDVISELLGVEPIEINSALVSAQNRKRLYWTNIPNVTQPNDKKIFLKDILETPGIGVIKNHGTYKPKTEKSQCLDANYFKGVDNHGQRTMVRVGSADLKRHDYIKRVYSVEGKSPTLAASSGGNLEPKISTSKTHWRKLTPIECERLQTVPDNYTQGVSNTQRYKMLGNGWTVDVIVHIFKNMEA